MAPWLTQTWLRIKALVRRRQLDQDLADELQFHQEMLQREPAPHRHLGNAVLLKESSRDLWTFLWLETMLQDVRYAARLLRRTPAFTAPALIALALGIGANSVIFSVVNAVLLRSLPYPDAAQLVALGERRAREGARMGFVSPADYLDWHSQNTVLSHSAALETNPVNLTGPGSEPQRLVSLLVTPEFLDVLRVRPLHGRGFTPADGQPGHERTTILTYGLWQRRFGGDPSVVGRVIQLNNAPHEVIGVLPQTFWWNSDAALLTPLVLTSEDAGVRALHYLSVIARRNPGVSLDQVRADFAVIGGRLEKEHSENRGHLPDAVPLSDFMVGNLRTALLVLLGAVGLVLLIASANVATLLLARAAARQREIALRLSIGASRSRLVRQFLTESTLLSLLGGAAGLLLARWTLAGLPLILPERLAFVPGLAQVSLDARVLLATFAVTILTGLLFGSLPAFTIGQGDISGTLKAGARSAAGGRRSPVRQTLVIVETAFALVLLIAAGLLFASFRRLLEVQPGFQPQNVLAMELSLSSAKYQEHARIVSFHEALLARMASRSGVQAAGAATSLPFTGSDPRLSFEIENRSGDSKIPVRAHPRLVSPGYLTAMGIPLRRGRYITSRDAQGSPDVVIVNEAAAQRFWPGEDPIGKRISFSHNPPRWLEIIGITGNIHHQGLDADPNPEAYLSYLQSEFFQQARNMTVAMRFTADPKPLMESLRGEVAAVDPDQPVSSVRAMEDLISQSIAPRRLNLWLLGIFAAIALALTAEGIFGVMSYLVAQRTPEIGVRMALGATRADVLWMVARQGCSMTLAGIAAGMVAAVALTRYLESLLYAVKPGDPLVFTTVSIGLLAVALAASIIPAWRASRIDPLVALRHE